MRLSGHPCSSGLLLPSGSAESSKQILRFLRTGASARTAPLCLHSSLRAGREFYGLRFSCVLRLSCACASISCGCGDSSALLRSPHGLEAQEKAGGSEPGFLPVVCGAGNDPSLCADFLPALDRVCCGGSAGSGCGRRRCGRPRRAGQAIGTPAQADSAGRAGGSAGVAALRREVFRRG
jgi:hypothetical protein